MGDTATTTELGATLAARVEALVDEVLAGTPHFLVEVAVRGARGSRVVEVYVESDGALGLDELARISRDLAFLLDTQDLIDGRYRLNVSSPGLDRPLRLPRQYRKNVGRSLRVHHSKPEGDGNTETHGELLAADDAGITLSTADGATRRVLYEDILWALVQLPW